MTDADWAKFTGTSQVVLRNGQTIDGSLYDIGGTSPLRLTIRTNNGEREVSSNEVARIVIARPENAVGDHAAAPASRNTPPVAGRDHRPGEPGRGPRPASPSARARRVTFDHRAKCSSATT